MLDPRQLLTHYETVHQGLTKRSAHHALGLLQACIPALEKKQFLCQQRDALQNKRNKAASPLPDGSSQAMSWSKEEKKQLSELKRSILDLTMTCRSHLLQLPNLPDDSVPVGKTAEENQVVSHYRPPTQFAFQAKDHVELGQGLGEMDFETAAQMSGSRFVVLFGSLAKLHRALAQFMLDLHTQKGYLECYLPYLVHTAALEGTGQLPAFSEDLFRLGAENGKSNDHWLIPTSEVPLNNLVKDRLLSSKALPLKYVAHSPCFRAEAGSYGKDTRGMLRQHQFDKVELVQITLPEASEEALETLTQDAEAVLQALELPYRKVVLCTGDLGFSACKTYDLEVWLPGQNQYREIASCSNTRDFQARRLNARYRGQSDKKPRLVHTLNGSGLAVGRTLIAVLENYQEADGRIRIPNVLQSYFQGAKYIG